MAGVDPGSPLGRSMVAQKQEVQTLRAALRRSLATEGPWRALSLSGGGQWGAFGAGFMKGWTERGDRPQFDVVTGTSTGSLIATFAFLGPDYDDQLGEAYLSIQGDGDIFKKRFALLVPFSVSLYTTGPLRQRLEGTITADILGDVATQGETGRQLFVGAVDIDRGVFRPFNLTAIAARGGEDARQDYIDALMASTAIPVAFPPVAIDGATYVDGGVRRNIFLEAATAELGQMQSDEDSERDATVYSLVNGTLNVGHKDIRRRVLDIARRSTDVLLDESTDGNLLRIFLQAQKEEITFLMTLIPSDICDVEGSPENQFDPDLMRCLYDEGRKIARDNSEPWRSEPPLDSGGP